MDQNGLIIAMLKAKQYITPLEKDILDTWNELQKVPFDMNSAERQIVSNDANYPQIAAIVAALPNTVPKARNQIAEIDLQYILSMQLSCLIETEDEKRAIPPLATGENRATAAFAGHGTNSGTENKYSFCFEERSGRNSKG